MNAIREAMDGFLRFLPESDCDAEALCRAAEHFGLTAADIRTAAEKLPLNHDLGYKGVRMLIAGCLMELASMFGREERARCEVSVPAPVCAMLAFADCARDKIRFSSGAFFAQIVLRGLFLFREPMDLTSCPKRRCGLNKMREHLLSDPELEVIDYQLTFGVLCDECVKTSGLSQKSCRTVSVSFPKNCSDRRALRAMAEAFAERTYAELGFRAGAENYRNACKLYGRMLAAEKKIARLNARPDRRPLMGNSLALTQSVLLMTADKTEYFVSALELLAEEMENAPEARERRRIFCFYVPFLQPEIDRRFRENGVYLVGGGAFLERESCPGLDIADSVAAWLCGMNIRARTEDECRTLAKAMRENGCGVYLTGNFAFDRWLGAAVPLQRKLLKEKYGLSVRTLEADFWCENLMFGSALERIDHICEMLITPGDSRQGDA